MGGGGIFVVSLMGELEIRVQHIALVTAVAFGESAALVTALRVGLFVGWLVGWGWGWGGFSTLVTAARGLGRLGSLCQVHASVPPGVGSCSLRLALRQSLRDGHKYLVHIH